MAEAKSESKDFDEIDDLCVRSIGVLAANMVQKANSGHPGAPMGMSAIAHVLWSKIMTGNSANSAFPNRDRFVLSNGHACALQYSMLHLNGYALSMSDLQSFRQLDSKTPGHPENHLTDGVECSTGPLGQGVAQAVGMAIAAKYAQSMFGAELFNSTIYTLCGDGCLQEGVCAEAVSLAGHLQLDNLIVLYDDNDIQIDGSTELAFTEDVPARFTAYKWNVLSVDKGNEDLQGILDAIKLAQATKDKPTLICVKTAIGFGSTKQGSHKVHGAPLGDECLAAYTEKMGLKTGGFAVDPKVYARYKETFGQRGKDAESAWNKIRQGLSAEKQTLLTRLLKGELPQNWESALPTFDETSKSTASRNMNGDVLNALAKAIPEIIGGAADLTPSTKTELKCSHDFQAKSRDGRYLRFGVREFGMFAVGNGIAAFGLNLIPFTATFLNFLGYGMGAVRLGALSKLRHIYVMTHDSVLLGEDGPTHQPVEALPACRSMPNLLTFRPCDGNEVSQTWRLMLERTDGPSVIALSRQSIDVALVSKYTKNGVAAKGVANGAYVLNGAGQGSEEKEETVDVCVIASGSEVELALRAAEALEGELKVRVVSANCLELFDQASLEYRKSVLPPGVLVVSIEASSTYGWAKYAHKSIGVKAFGKSAPLASIREDFGFNAPALIKNIQETVAAWKKSGEVVPLLPTLFPF